MVTVCFSFDFSQHLQWRTNHKKAQWRSSKEYWYVICPLWASVESCNTATRSNSQFQWAPFWCLRTRWRRAPAEASRRQCRPRRTASWRWSWGGDASKPVTLAQEVKLPSPQTSMCVCVEYQRRQNGMGNHFCLVSGELGGVVHDEELSWTCGMVVPSWLCKSWP